MKNYNLLMYKLSGCDIIKTLSQLGYEVYKTPYKVNIVGVRAATDNDNTFNDCIMIFWFDYNGHLEIKMFKATTDPGHTYLNQPMNDKGCAILKAGQYIDTYGKGSHKGKPALIQQRNVTVYRDHNRDSKLDFNDASCETGMFGINIHRAGKDSVYINNWSAGCQVIANENDYLDFYQQLLLDPSVKYTYTLINENDLICVE